MLISAFYLLMALLGLGFLIFIHELGHYFMAKRVGMRVETFSIGFGKPLLSWTHQGTQWQIGWLLFGGYVKIAGTDTRSDLNPYEIPDGFFGKRPLDRILVSAMGPIVNLVFAFVAFSLLWMVGGREQSFSQHTHKIGWVDPASQLYQGGVRPGDEITAYDGVPYRDAQDHLYAPLLADGPLSIVGNKFDYATQTATPYALQVETYPHPELPSGKSLPTSGILSPASYLVYDKAMAEENPLPPYSPMAQSGIKPGDRIVWVDGLLVFSLPQLEHLLNDGRLLLTLERNGQKFLRRVPRVPYGELKLDPSFRAELSDWQFEAKLPHKRFSYLWGIPYEVTSDAVVERRLSFIDKEAEEKAFPAQIGDSIEKPLSEGDRIIAVDGQPIQDGWQLLAALQNRKTHLIVQSIDPQPANWLSADRQFDQSFDIAALQELISTIGTKSPLEQKGSYRLLNPIEPISRLHYFSLEGKGKYKELIQQQKARIEAIQDPEQRTAQMQRLQEELSELFLGLPSIRDGKVLYNPDPINLFQSVFDDVRRTLVALLQGSLSLEWIRGPVGIVQVVHQQTIGHLREALFWLGMISLNLGILNLLPIPVLDGGTILFSFFELCTGRRLSTKVMEWLILPFALLLIAFFLYITFHDVVRLFKGFFGAG